MWKRIFGITMIFCLANAAAPTMSLGEEMIQVNPDGTIDTPFKDQNGEPLLAIPVKITPVGENEVALEPMAPAQKTQGEPWKMPKLPELDVIQSMSLQYLHPLSWSASYGFVIVTGRQSPGYDGQYGIDGSALIHHDGILIQVQAGVHGGQIAFGLAQITSSQKPGVFQAKAMAMDVKLVALRTWGTPRGPVNGPDQEVGPDQVYAGVEADFSFYGVKFSLSFVNRILGDEPVNPNIFGGNVNFVGWGVGFGF
jgi:hypothetical protein